MAYADHSQASSRTTAIVFVAVIHVVLGYAFYNGLNVKTVSQIIETVDVFNVKKPPPPPPPPKKPAAVKPPPIKPVVVPPPTVKVTQPVEAPVVPKPAPPAVVVPAPPAPPAVKASRAIPRGSPGSWVTSDDYPSAAYARQAQGTTGFRLEVGPDGRVTSCSVTSSSGNPDLDATTCRLLPKRARFKPAIGSDGQPTSDTYSNRVRWQMPG